jgi:hypothetical protein
VGPRVGDGIEGAPGDRDADPAGSADAFDGAGADPADVPVAGEAVGSIVPGFGGDIIRMGYRL